MTTKDSLKKYTEAIGRRKTARARVRISDANSLSIVVNGKTLEEYFPVAELQVRAKKPLANYPHSKLFISVLTNGGGISAQADSFALGLARALALVDPTHKPILRQAGLLSRDSRIKERRKFGLKKARKAPQWSKR